MLLEALDHPKTLHLASLLGVELPTAIGHLELLWAFTGKKAPRGDVGKFPAGAIAGACYWRGNPDAFTGALVAAGFVDPDPTHGMLIHDWPDHAPRWVKAKLAKARQTFALPTVSTDAGTDAGTVVATTVATNTRSLRVEKGSQAKPREGDGETAASRTAVATSEGTAAGGQDDAYTLTQRVQQVYPAGLYGAQNWILTERELGKLLDGGDHAPELLDAAKAYGDQQQALGNVGTQYIRSPAKFYGEGHWRGPFPMPAERQRQPGARKSFAEIHRGLSTTDDEQSEAQA